MSIGNIVSVAEGVGYGLGLTEMKRLGDSMYAGRNIWSGTLFQTAQADIALSLTGKALEAAGSSPVPLPLRVVLFLSPAVLALLTKHWGEGEEANEQPQTQATGCEIWRSVAVFLQDEISNLCQVAALVSSVALIYFGSIPFGVAALAMVGMGFLDRATIFPDNVRQVIHTLIPPLAYATGLFTGNFFNILFSLTNIFAYCARHYQAWVEAHREIPPIPENAMDDVQRFLEGERDLAINRDYIFWPTHAPEIPNIDIKTLVDHFEVIDWENPKNIEALRDKLTKDRRFRERCGDPALKTDGELVLVAHDQLLNCVIMVMERRITSGAPRKYEKLIEYMQLIAHELPKERSDVERIDALVSLAIEAGEYCGPRVFDIAEQIAGSLIGESEFFTFHSKILNCLQSARNRAVEGIYAEIFGLQQDREMQQESSGIIEGLGRVLRWDDPHNFHHFQNLVGEEFRLRKAGADNDDLAIADYFLKLFISCVASARIEEWFWQRHNLSEIAQTVRGAIGTPEISEVQVYSWWLECIAQLNISDEKKQELRDELALAQQNEKVPGQFSDKFVRGMLLGMGILRVNAA